MAPTAGLRQLPPLGVTSMAPRESESPRSAAPPSVAIPLHWKLAVGGVAGAVGTATTFPIDIVKTHLQGQTRAVTGPIQCFKHIVATDGVRGLYRGLPPTLVGVLPEKAIKLAVNEQLREYFTDADGHLPMSKQILAGAGAGGAQAIVTNPMEIVKIRLQMQTSLPPAERQTAVQVVRSLGLRGLYRGMPVCFMRDIPYAVVFFPSYATLKDVFADKTTGTSSILSIVAAGATAGATAAAICTPADVIKTRLQLKGSPYTGILDCVRKVVAANGPSALLKGMGPRMMVQAPLFGITLVAFEIQKKYMESL